MLACQSVFGDGDNCNSSNADKHLQQSFQRAESHAKTGDYAGTLLTGQQCSDRGLTSEINSAAEIPTFQNRRILTIKDEMTKFFIDRSTHFKFRDLLEAARNVELTDDMVSKEEQFFLECLDIKDVALMAL